MTVKTGSLPAIGILEAAPAKPGRYEAAVIGVDAKGRPAFQPSWLDEAGWRALRRAARLFPKGSKAGALAGPVPNLGPNGIPGYLLRLPGVREADGWDNGAAERLGETVARRVAADGHGSVLLVLAAGGVGKESADRLARVLLAASLAAYRFDFRTKARPNDPARLERVDLLAPGAAAVTRAWNLVQPDVAGIAFARDLVNEPGNRIYPASFADRIARRLKPEGVAVEILKPSELQKLGMGALLAVGSGSAHPPRLVVMRWRGNGKGAPVALVGKGVTFDTGGIDIKPGARMEEMKGDMAGAAAVAGTMLALALRNDPRAVVGVVPLVENMPSGTAFRPGDVVRAFDGRTIEIIDTDAEGRLILADALAYTTKRFRPRAIVDMATLTGSVIAALGHLYAGVFANDDRLAASLIEAGRPVGERLWRLPLDPDYDEHLKSDIADIRQVAPDEESADAVHAAQFLQGFVDGTPWAHLDIAGVEWLRGEGRHGASGFAIRLLTGWLARSARPRKTALRNGSTRRPGA
jgi:leucyl aminopeptidase